MEDVRFFTELTLKISAAINAIWGLQITVLVAAMGWGVASRQWSKGLPPLVAVTAGITVLLFGAAGLYSLSLLYVRANDALELARMFWPKENGPVPGLYSAWAFTPGIFLAFDAVVAVAMALLLSNFWRPKPTAAPGHKSSPRRAA